MQQDREYTGKNNIYGLDLFSLKRLIDIQVEKFSGNLI